MIENIPTLLKAFDSASKAISAFTGWRAKSKGDARILVEELKENSRYLWLVIDDEVPIDQIVDRLSCSEYDRLTKENFNFNSLQNKKIAIYKSLDGTTLSAWQGKETGRLVASIYDKIKDIKTMYPLAKNSKKRRWPQRIKNVQERILLLLKHSSS
jgi:hypothetical protein